MKKVYVVIKRLIGGPTIINAIFQNKENALKSIEENDENFELYECKVEDAEDRKEITEKELNEDHETWASYKFRRKRK